MKSMNNINSNNNNNWLGVSLSPHINMEASSDSHHHHHPTHVSSSAAVSTAVPRSFFHLNNSGICDGVDGENGGFYSHLSVMPLKSDGSLCIMEALSRSQPEGPFLVSYCEGLVPSSSPKLEDFLGGATMASHQYDSSDRETMEDSIYYHHSSENENNRQRYLQQTSRQFQQHPYYFGLSNQEMYQAPLQQDSKDTHLADCSSQLSPVGEDGIPSLRNWVARHYPTHNGMEQKVDGFLCENGGSGHVGAMGYGDLQSLSLSMSPGSQSSCITAPQQISPTGTECMAMETKKRGPGGKVGQKQPVHRKSLDTFGQRTSQYRGVTRHRWTGRYEAHLWDNSCKKEGQTRKGRQGGYDMEEKAARSYDLAALKYWGPSTYINFTLENYRDELEEMKNMSRQEYVANLRRKSSGFSRGASIYRGVTRHHQHGRWQARIGRVAGNKDLYLGTFGTQEEAAEAYDIAAIKFRGTSAVTNFDMTRYDVERIMASNTLLGREHAKRKKEITSTTEPIDHHPPSENSTGPLSLGEEHNVGGSDWKTLMYQSSPQKPSDSVEPLDQKSNGIGSYRNTSFSGALHDLIMNSDQVGVEDQVHLSNSSSLVTSVNSSREGSPDKNGLSMLFARPPSGSKFLNPATSMNSWIPSAQLRSAESMPHMPMFAAWTDT
ncbi:hypothetical protein IFM89_022545 [Coptis chinensis]|uniref:AP2/ERF domain-containing protein n=1 Tax=Coptis chinensis TaxID=261450 RepID=A0A835ISL1_9MAGN|nr:hypothetical protein IFM89_022545 [Coptis chinensis]